MRHKLPEQPRAAPPPGPVRATSPARRSEPAPAMPLHAPVQLRSAQPGTAVAAFARSHADCAARTANRTGLPAGLKNGVETLSGISLDDVRVHRNSARPAQLQALAHTQGSDIHLGPGQERHLAHEAWHVVQQKQGRVRPTTALGGTAINDDAGLEREADSMGVAAAQFAQRPLANAHPMSGTMHYGEARHAHGPDVVQGFGIPAWLSGAARSASDRASSAASSVADSWASWRRGPVVNAQRAQFNSQQGPPPARGSIVNNTQIALGALDGQMAKLPRLRQLLDALIALHADGMLMQIQGINAAGHGKAQRRALYKDKRDLLALRLEIEKSYQALIRAKSAPSAAVLLQHRTAIQNAGAFLAGRAAAINTTVNQAPGNKTGQREPHSYTQGDVDVEDRAIDIRATALARAVAADGFIPKVVIGLPTGGIQIAARVAAYFHATALSQPKLLALRPRFVKPPGAGAAITPQQQEAINANDLTSAIMAHQLDAADGTLNILVVDDFSLSGGSLIDARDQIARQFTHMGFTIDVRTAVSRYTTAQMGGQIGPHNVPNQINYLTGQHASGTRASVSNQFLVGDDRYSFTDIGMDNAATVGRGWLETGEDALRGIGL